MPFSWLYGAIITGRNLMYDHGVFRAERVGLPIISVGNLTTGGTGKTPMVEYLVNRFLEAKQKPAVLSRGYKRTTTGTVVVSDGVTLMGTAESAGDEPFQIARKFPRAVVIVDEERARGARTAIDKFHPDVIILDDGFQRRSLARDLDIVMIDGTMDLADSSMLPAGVRREPLGGLRRADMLAVSEGDFGRALPVQADGKPAIHVKTESVQLRQLFSGVPLPLTSIQDKRAIAFCGIARPSSFRDTLKKIGLHVLDFVSYQDHHRFQPGDVAEIARRAENMSAQLIVTTEKDAVRFLPAAKQEFFQSHMCFYLEVKTVITEGESTFHELIDQTLARVYS